MLDLVSEIMDGWMVGKPSKHVITSSTRTACRLLLADRTSNTMKWIDDAVRRIRDVESERAIGQCEINGGKPTYSTYNQYEVLRR